MTIAIRERLALKIEPFDYTEKTYADAVEIHNRIWIDYPSTVADWKRWDRNRNPEHIFERFIARRADNDVMVGFGAYLHRSWAFHPRKFYFDLYVDPELHGLGIGRKMYDYTVNALAEHDPISLDTDTREDQDRAIRFLEERGYDMKTREHSSKLELANFDPEPWLDTVRFVEQSGIVVKNLIELRRDDPDHARKLYDMVNEIDKDIPYHAEITPDPYDLWLKRFEDSPNRIDEAFLIALDGDEYAGITMLSSSQATDKALFTGLTGVMRNYRRRGIATALKVRALSYAKDNFRTADGNIPYVSTENEINNPMYQINVRLGFVKAPDWMSYVKALLPDAETETEE
jgi:GNAT superfamily N-acetyltransferase